MTGPMIFLCDPGLRKGSAEIVREGLAAVMACRSA